MRALISLTAVLFGCQGGYDAALGIWYTGELDLVSFDCEPNDGPPESMYEPFEVGIFGYHDDLDWPVWKPGERIYLNREGFFDHFGVGEISESGLDTPPYHWTGLEDSDRIRKEIVEHHAVLADDFTLDWLYLWSWECEALEAGGCEFFDEAYPTGCEATWQFTAVWDRES